MPQSHLTTHTDLLQRVSICVPLYVYMLQYIVCIYISYISHISLTIYCNAVRAKRCELQRTDRRGGRRAATGVEGEVPTGRMSNKQKLLKIIVAYLADSRGMPQTRRQGGSAVGQGKRCHCCLLLGASKATHKRFAYPANEACCM